VSKVEGSSVYRCASRRLEHFVFIRRDDNDVHCSTAACAPLRVLTLSVFLSSFLRSGELVRQRVSHRLLAGHTRLLESSST
jgi:hypothetical protein